MDIFGFSIYRSKKETKQSKGNIPVTEKDEENVRERLTVKLFSEALQSIESPTEPYRFDYSKCIEVALLHPTIVKSLNIRESFANFCKYKFVDKNGNDLENLDEILKTKWFRHLKKAIYRSIVTGHELIELKDLSDVENPVFDAFPNWLLLTSMNRALNSSNDTIEKSIDYTIAPYVSSNINCRYNKYGKGILTPVLQEVAMSSTAQWSIETKSFTNTRIFTTGSWDDEQVKNYISKIDRNRDGILLKQGETFDIKSADKSSGDSHKALNDYIDKQFQGVILGSSITDEQSFVGSVEVQKDLLEMIVSEDRDYICDCINNSICLTTYGLIPQGAKLVWEKTNKLSEQNQIEMHKLAITNFDVAPDVVENITGVEVLRSKKQNTTNDKGRNI